MSEIFLFNTLGREKQVFVPIKKGQVNLYSCGPTVYWFAHIGNFRSYLFADVLKRVLQFNGLKVNHVMNITDVGHLTSDGDEGEDKMIKALRREGKEITVESVKQVAKKYETAFLKDMRKLNILKPDKLPHASDYVKDMVAFIKKIEKNGFAYKTKVGMTFDTGKFENYAELGKLNLEQLKEGATGKKDIGRKSPSDFALWIVNQPTHIMQWESPWGKGFPGWHLECSVLSIKFLKQIDIHTGGIDHIPIHHSNEIAQNFGATGKKCVNYWMHNNFLLLNKGKMAKSGGDILTLWKLSEKGYDPLVYRYFFLSAHYRSQQNFTWESLDAAKNAFERLKNLVLELKSRKDSKGRVDDYRKKFLQKVNDDLNTPEALAVMWKVLREKSLGGKEKLKLVLEFDNIFGLGLDGLKKEKMTDEIAELVEKRDQARRKKDFETSDIIRDELKEKGWIIKDGKSGPVLKRI
jgi:cysteinyl-tRNA synthetase